MDSKADYIPFYVTLMLCIVLLLNGCAGLNKDKINDIANHPDNYTNKEVHIAGQVTDGLEVPMMNIALYRVKDDTGEIWVTSHAGVPAKGDKVDVKGKVNKDVKLPIPIPAGIQMTMIEESSREANK